MMYEETLPAGTASLFHLHRDSDEVAWVLVGEFSFMIGEAVTVGGPDDLPAVALEEFVAVVVVGRAALRERLNEAPGGGRV